MRLIDADALKARVAEEAKIVEGFGVEMAVLAQTIRDSIYEELENSPTIEAEPIKHAKWEQDLFGTLWVCSACNMPTDVKSASKYFKYCPFCGAKMKKGIDDETD